MKRATLLVPKEVDTAIKSASWRKKLYRSYDNGGSSPNFPVKSPYGSPGSVKLLVPPTCFWGGTRFEVPRFS